MTTAPCKDCADRHPGCHSECEWYMKYSKERAEMLKNKKDENDYQQAHSRQACNALWRKKKRERRK